MSSLTSLYLGVIVPASTLIPITIGIIKYRRLVRRQRALLLYLCIAVTVNAIATIYSHHNNLPLLHVYTMLEFILLVRYYVLVFSGRKTVPYLVAAAIIFPVFCVVNFLFIQSIYTYNSYTRPVEAIFLVLHATLVLIMYILFTIRFYKCSS